MTSVCIFNGDMSRGGGTERISQVLANALCKEPGYRICVLNLNNEAGTSFFPLEKEVGFHVLPAGGVLQKIRFLRRFVKREKIDVLIDVDVMLGIFSLPVVMTVRRLKLISWEMFNLRNQIGSRHTPMIRALALKKSAYYINQTKGDMEAFQREMKVRCPITYIYNPCDDSGKDARYAVDSKTIVTAGHFFRTKGYDLAVEVARIVRDRHPDWSWEFYGDGKELAAIQEQIARYDLGSFVRLMGRTSHISEVYQKASLYVMTSRTEGFGLVLTEAKSFHLPTLAFDCEFGPREIIEDGVSGYLVPAFDVSVMADRICELIEDQEKRRSFADHARDNLDRFSLSAFKAKWLEVLTQVEGKNHE